MNVQTHMQVRNCIAKLGADNNCARRAVKPSPGKKSQEMVFLRKN